MKGLYILLALAALLAALVYLAFRDTGADLRREHETLLVAIGRLEEMLKEAQAPLDGVRSEKPTDRLDKEYHRLRSRVAQARRALNAVQHSIDNPSAETRSSTLQSLQLLRQQVDGLLLEVPVFQKRVALIARLTGESAEPREAITILLRKIEARAAEKSAAGEPISPELEERIERAATSADRAIRLISDSLNLIWQDPEQGELLAERTVSELKGCLPTLRTLLDDLNRAQ